MSFTIINRTNYDYLSKNNTLWIRGLMALLIFIAHVPSYLGLFSGTAFGSVLTSVAAPFVAIFFFLSGFGLATSYLNKGVQYLFYLPKNRILPLYLKYLMLLCCYIGLSFALGNMFDKVVLIKSFFIGDTYVANGWYLQTLILFYFIFFTGFVFPISDNKKLLLTLILSLIYYGVFYYLGIESGQHYWFSSVLLFPIGIIYALKRNFIDAFLNKRKYITFIGGLLLILFAGIILIFRKQMNLPVYLLGLQSTIISVFFAIGIIIMLRFLNLNFGVTRLLGKFSFEIYVLQGAAFQIAKSSWLSVNNAYLQLLLAILITAALCIPFHYLFKWIDSIFKKEKAMAENAK